MWRPMNNVIDRLLAALNAHDVEAFISCYSPDATIEDGHDRILAKGHSEFRERYSPMFETYPSLHVEPLNRWTVGSFVTQDERVTGGGPGSDRHIAIYQIENDLVVRERLLR